MDDVASLKAALESSKRLEAAHGISIGVLGGGQLGRMMAQAASRLGLKLTVLDPGGLSSDGFGDAGLGGETGLESQFWSEQPEGEGGAVLMPVGEMVGSAEEQDALPEWIVDVVAERHRVPDSAKASFHLAPHESQPDAPRLSQGRGTAPRVLGVRKGVDYVVQKLGPDGAAPEDLVDILCGGEVCDPAMSLATAHSELASERAANEELRRQMSEMLRDHQEWKGAMARNDAELAEMRATTARESPTLKMCRSLPRMTGM